VALLRFSSPLTVAGPRRILTGFQVIMPDQRSGSMVNDPDHLNHIRHELTLAA
jgi:hypothetical protein